MVTVIKSSPDFDDAEIIDDLECDDLVKIVANGNIASACDIFHKLLGMSRKDYYSAYRDLGDCLLPRIRSFHSPIAIFIDNVDEYFNRAVSYSDRSRVEDDIRHTLWVNAQLGLAKAAREINSVNNHIKVFASVRQEAFQISRRRDPLALQILGNTLQLEYDFDDLKEVLLKNIEAEDVRNLVSPSAQDPIERFFGKHASVIEHSYTNEDETIINFVLRHTLMRPRDICFAWWAHCRDTAQSQNAQ